MYLVLEALCGIVPPQPDAETQRMLVELASVVPGGRAELRALVERIRKEKERGSLIDTFASLAQEYRGNDAGNEIAAFKKIYGLRNKLLHPARITVSLADAEETTDLAQRMLSAIIGHSNKGAVKLNVAPRVKRHDPST
jgi:hypothetical protein